MTFISIFASLLLSANSVADTSVVVSEPTVISSDTTVQTVLPDSAVIAEQHIKDTVAVVAKDTTVAEKDTAEGWHFTTVDSVAITPVKDQHRSSTCWAYSTLGFLESEVLRTKGKEVDFAEMFVVNKTMMDRATYCVRMYNDVKFAAGGSAYEALRPRAARSDAGNPLRFKPCGYSAGTCGVGQGGFGLSECTFGTQETDSGLA